MPQIETSEELRKRLKNARSASNSENIGTGNSDTTKSSSGNITTSSTGADIERYVPNGVNPLNGNEQSVEGLHNGVRSTIRATNNIERKLSDLAGSLAQINKRERSTDRRPSSNNSQNRSDGTDLSASDRQSKSRNIVGNLESFDPIPPRFFENETERINTETETKTTGGKIEGATYPLKRGRKSQQTNNGPLQIKQITDETEKPNIVKRTITAANSGKVLSKTEAQEIKEPFIKALSDELEMIDKAIWKVIDDPIEQPVWSDMSEKEIDTIASVILRVGQRSPVVASIARTNTDAGDFITAGMIIAPRFRSTVNIIREHRKKNEATSRRERIRNLRSTHTE